MATKEQERKALEQIREIVEGLGSDSYIATAFEGVFEDAEENIEFDFGNSWKDRAVHKQEENVILKKRIEALEEENEALEDNVKELAGKVLTGKEKDATTKVIFAAREDVAKKLADTANAIVKFAEDPDSIEFKDAVRANRDAERLLENIDIAKTAIITR